MLVKRAFFTFGALHRVLGGQCSGGIQITSQGDAERLSNCVQYSGDISVSQLKAEEVDFGNLAEVYGSIVIENNFNLKSILLEGLAILNGTLRLKDNIQLLGLSIPRLHTLRKLSISNTPNLNTLNINTIVNAASVEISQTAITELSGLAVKQCESVIFANNIYLKKIEMANLTTISKQFAIIDNNQQSVASFPLLGEIGGNVTLQGLSAVSLPKLKKVSDTVNIIENGFSELSMESLFVFGNDLNIIENKGLTQLSFLSLKEVKKGLVIQNNTNLANIDKDSFPKLEKVGEKILITGSVKSVLFPSLKMVNKAVTITSSEKLDCPNMKKNFGFLNSNMWICKTNIPVENQDSSKPNKNSGGGSGNGNGSKNSSGKENSNTAQVLRYDNFFGFLAFSLLPTIVLV